MANSEFTREDMLQFEPEAKVGLLATVNSEGLPHITLITSLQAGSPTTLIWGQFCEGLSKRHVRSNSKTGFLIMSLERELWRGKALWTSAATSGEDFNMFNRKPMFRYNSYLGIHTVHTMRLVETHGRERLPMARIVAASLLTRLARPLHRTFDSDPILKPWALGLFRSLSSLKFLSYIGYDGFPVLIPLIQCQAADSRRLVFAAQAYGRELRAVPRGVSVAVFGLTLQMEDVLVRGRFGGFSNMPGSSIGTIDLDWVYNSMPPVPGQIYPERGLRAVETFS